jgi:NADH-quinone oxidoreductase subunit I
MNRLRTWMDTVPPPQPLDPGADQGKELQAYEAARPAEDER